MRKERHIPVYRMLAAAADVVPGTQQNTVATGIGAYRIHGYLNKKPLASDAFVQQYVVQALFSL